MFSEIYDVLDDYIQSNRYWQSAYDYAMSVSLYPLNIDKRIYIEYIIVQRIILAFDVNFYELDSILIGFHRLKSLLNYVKSHRHLINQMHNSD